MFRLVSPAVLCAALLLARPAHAEEQHRFCVALDARCDSQLLLRAGFGLTLNHDADYGRYNVLPTVGLMFDRGHHDWAAGAAFIAILGQQARVGVEIPVRYWLSDRTALELAPGVLSNPGPGITPSLRAGIYTHWVGLGLRYSVPRFDTYTFYPSGALFYRTERRHELTLEAAITGLPAGVALAAGAIATVVLATVLITTYAE